MATIEPAHEHPHPSGQGTEVASLAIRLAPRLDANRGICLCSLSAGDLEPYLREAASSAELSVTAVSKITASKADVVSDTIVILRFGDAGLSKKELASTSAALSEGGARAVLLYGPDGDLHQTAAPGFQATHDQLTEAGLEVAWAGLTFSDIDAFERHDIAFALAPTGDDDARDALRDLLATGIRNLSLDPRTIDADDRPAPARICIATNEIFGPTKNGGIGTAYTSLAEALAAGGHDVTILYLGEVSDEQGIDHWQEHYRERRIRLAQVETAEHPHLDWEHDNIRYAHLAYSWLRREHTERPFDVIHLPECNGHGFFVAAAKHQGLAFHECTLCIGTHSSTEWIFQANNVALESFFNLSSDFLERGSIRHADAVLGPSLYLLQWMRQHHWELPEQHVFQQQYIQPHSARGGLEAAESPPRPVTELVFFGRLETRKGLTIFCDALDTLAETVHSEESDRSEEVSEDLQITFMGKVAMVDGAFANDYIEQRSATWPFRIQLIDDLQQDAAVAYLQGEGRVAIMASPVDNSPNTVYEAIGLGVPFIASRTGGIPELIHPADVATHTFYHRDLAKRGALLAQCIVRALQDGHRPARPAISQDINEQITLAWHSQTGELHREARIDNEPSIESAPTARVSLCVAVMTESDATASKRLLETVQYQTHENFEVILATHGDGILCMPEGTKIVTDEAATSSASLLNAAAREASGEFLLFAQPSTAMEPHEVETFLRVQARTGAGILCAYHHQRNLEGGVQAQEEAMLSGLLPDYPVGGHPALNLLKPAAGSGHVFVSKEAYAEVGGFVEDRPNPRPEQVFLTVAASSGIAIETIPQPLFRWDGQAEPDPGTTTAYQLDLLLSEPFAAALPAELKRLPHFCRAQGHRSGEMIKHMNWLKKEVVDHKAFIEEREQARRDEKSELKSEITDLKKQLSESRKETKAAEDLASRPFWKRR